MDSDGGLVPLAIFYSHAEAIVVRSMLEAHAIPAFLFDWHMISGAPHLMTACGGIKLHVCREDLPAALQLIAAADQRAPAPPAFNRRPFWNGVAAIFIWMLTGTAPPPRVPGEILPRI